MKNHTVRRTSKPGVSKLIHSCPLENWQPALGQFSVGINTRSNTRPCVNLFYGVILYRVMRSRLKDGNTKISPERAPDKLRRIQHQVIKVNDLEPIAGLSSINQEHTEILQALTLKKPTLPTQLTLL